ncbi:MAG: hypothetical protein RLZZ399_930 [Verrucomicrobiota bacterium]|jgi:hypothetical protein
MIHNVYFWLKKDLSAEQRALFEAELRKLSQIPYLEGAVVSRPAPTEARPVTDHSFDFSMSARFKNMEDHEFYQKQCELHLRFVQICKPFFERVIVYDNEPLA